MDGFLFLAHIGPIQAFIASSRRTRDLYYGSGLLSEASKVVAYTIARAYTVESLIFPAPESEAKLKPGSVLDVANKVLAYLPPDASPEVLGARIKINIDSYLARREAELMVKIGGELAKEPESVDWLKINWKTVQDQLSDMIEYFWVALPPGKDDYATSRLKLEAIMAARKNVRLFQQPSWGSAQSKSSISGELESVLPEQLYATDRMMRREQIHADVQRKLQRNADLLVRLFGAGPAERLSGVDLLKRRGSFLRDGSVPKEDDRNKRLDFPSTSHIAALPYLACLKGLSEPEKQALKETWEAYIQKTRALAASQTRPIERIKGFAIHPVLSDYDGGMLYTERLIQDTDYAANLAPAQAALEIFFKEVNSYFEHSIAPSPYYAILIADGDSMGSVIDHQADGSDGMEQHRQLTQKLAEFARVARGIVENGENQGVAIYTGGDDVMAFLPLHRVLPCSLQLALAFREHMGAFLNAEGKPATLSAGIAIVHHLELLQESLNIARAAEKRAKGVEGKDAVAITLAKRGGEHYSVAGHWNNVDHYITQLMHFYASQSIPKGIAYDIRETVQRLEGLGDDSSSATNIIRADIQRILLRRLLNLHQGLERDDRAPAAPERHVATTLYELLQARICDTPDQFEDVRNYTRRQRKKLQMDKEEGNKVSIQPIRDARGNIDFQEFANELLIAQTLAETEMLLGTKRKEA
ncbi:MAG TPA: type III-B CRISPR-associated protein Cas10/Cmr2 [Ktedonobacteraceae bacterium]|jgi:CRISPR-associated protein Cmr2|nr:type III-B CRISPR-associated protein Cas10/Cmr2 [Ktedonobacteraceae bacterium]